MIEILVWIGLGRKLMSMAKERGRSGAWGLLGPAMWIGGEIFGFIVGALMGLEMYPSYGIAIVCAILGGVVSYFIVKSLEPTALAADADGFQY